MKIPAQLRQLTGGQAEVNLDSAANVKEMIDKLRESYPDLGDRLVDESGQIRRFVNIYVGDEDVRFLDGVDTTLDEHSQVAILPAVAGGLL